MSQAGTKPPGGTRDFLPDDIRRREYVMRIVREVYESYGFEPLETPAFENIETLLGKYGEEGNKLIFKILRRGEHEASGEADLALRYDLTVPLARVVAQYQNELPRFFKRYQIQPVWRADRPARGRFREFYQCDIDAIGSTSPVVEAELLAAVSEVLTRLGFDDFVIRLNHRRVLTALLECAGMPEPLHGEALVALDKLDKIGPTGVEAELRGARDRRRRDAGLPRVPDRRARRRPASRRRRSSGFATSCAAITPARRAVDELDQIVRLADGTAGARPDPDRSQPGARAVILHRRDHGDCRAGSAGQPRRRRPLRQPGRHVPRPRRAGVRVLARPRADHRGDDRAGHVSGQGVARRRST